MELADMFRRELGGLWSPLVLAGLGWWVMARLEPTGGLGLEPRGLGGLALAYCLAGSEI